MEQKRSMAEAAGGRLDDSKREEVLDPKRREALARLATYTAPAMLALLASSEDAGAGTCVSSNRCRISDVRLKRDVAALGQHADGINLYRFRYLWSDTIHVGVMAQEVAATRPDAVQQGADGYLRVDYARLGLRIRTWDEWTSVR
jgi:hypothetical protein